MANAWFRFKQFTIEQSRCAMKVGMDGVTLGAWTPVEGAQRILDIGTGSGLIALMLAQRAPWALIDALEIEPAAAQQAQENVLASPWPDRVQVHTGALQTWQAPAYDLIVSNPPYFVPGPPAATVARDQARSTHTLSHADLLQHALRLLAPRGRLALILPTEVGERCQQLAGQFGLVTQRRVRLTPCPGKASNRYLLLFSRENIQEVDGNIMIRTADGDYCETYASMVSPFYLKL